MSDLSVTLSLWDFKFSNWLMRKTVSKDFFTTVSAVKHTVSDVAEAAKFIIQTQESYSVIVWEIELLKSLSFYIYTQERLIRFCFSHTFHTAANSSISSHWIWVPRLMIYRTLEWEEQMLFLQNMIRTDCHHLHTLHVCHCCRILLWNINVNAVCCLLSDSSRCAHFSQYWLHTSESQCEWSAE